MVSLDADKFNLDKKFSAFNRKCTKSVDKLNNQISNLKKKNKKYVDMLIDGIIDEETCKDYAKINNEEISRLQTELADLNTQQTKQRPDLSAIRSEIVKVINLEVLERELLNMLIDRIDVNENGELKVVYTFSSPITEYNYREVKAI